MAMSRNKKWSLRSALHQAELMIPKTDRSKQAEKERDLLSEAAVALWSGKMAKLWTCLRRLAMTGARTDASLDHIGRGAAYLKIIGMLNQPI